MLLNGVDMNIFLEDFRKCILSIIVKQDNKAALYETAETKRKADKYCAMMDGTLTWSSFGNFNKEVLEAAGLSHDLLNSAQANKELIPYDFREICMNLQRRYTIDHYVEENNYYRMLHGEPDLEDEDLIYLGANIWGLTPDVPVHQLPSSELDYINNSEVIGILQEKYPTKKYLFHLGEKSISYFRARTALNYEILYLEKTRITEISNKFTQYYANSRNYVMLGLYNKEDIEFYNDYDNFMGFVILTMAINRTFASIFTQGITREFYDDNLIRDLFENYNISYEESIDVKYQREIAKKLNLLLQYKASNQVLFDITSLFSYRKVNIYKYYLMKDYKKDKDGNPIVIYKKVTNEEGEVVEVLDYENTYDIYFQKVNIKSKDPIVEISDPSNRVEYEALTGDDPYWVQDSDLITKLYQNKFNSIITKYMTIDVMFDLTKLIYETCHAFRLIFDRNEDTKKIKINLPYVDEPVSMYDVVTFLCALVAKKFGLKGEIPLEPHNIATVYGFNFKTDIDYLREEILDDIENNYGRYSKVDPELLSFIKTTKMNSVDDVRKMYEDIENLRIFIDTAMRYTKDIDAYYAYKKIYQSLLITTDIDEVYLKNDGTPAKTFYELLANRRPDLKMVIDQTDPGHYTQTYDEDSESGQEYDNHEINNTINFVLDRLGEISDRLSDMRFTNEKIEIVSNIEKVVNQMKSYTVDQNESGVIYMLNDPHMCMLKILDWLYFADIGMTREEHSILVDDLISEIKLTNKFNEKLKVTSSSKAFAHITQLYKTFMKFFHKIDHIFKEKYAESKIEMTDVINGIHKNLVLPFVYQKLWERYYVEKTNSVKDDIIFFDGKELWKMFVDLSIDSDEHIRLDDMISENKIAIAYLMSLALKEEIVYQIKIQYKEEIKFIHKICKDKNLSFRMTTELIDTLLSHCDETIKDRFKIRDFGNLIQIFHFNDLMKLVNEITSYEKTELVKSVIDLLDTCILTGYKIYKQSVFFNDKWFMDNVIHIDLYLKYKEALYSEKHEDFDMTFNLIDTMLLHGDEYLKQNLSIRDLYHMYMNRMIDEDLRLKESYRLYLLKTYGSKIYAFDTINQISLDRYLKSSFNFKDRYYPETFDLRQDEGILSDKYDYFKWNYLNNIVSFFDSLSLVCSYSNNAEMFKLYERKYYEYVIYPIEKILSKENLLLGANQKLSNPLTLIDSVHLQPSMQINEESKLVDMYRAYFTYHPTETLFVDETHKYWLLKNLKTQFILSDSLEFGKDSFVENFFKMREFYNIQMGYLMKSFVFVRDMLQMNNWIEIRNEHLLYDLLTFSSLEYAKENIFSEERLRKNFLFQVSENLPVIEGYKCIKLKTTELNIPLSDNIEFDKHLNTISEDISLSDSYEQTKLETYFEHTIIEERYMYDKEELLNDPSRIMSDFLREAHKDKQVIDHVGQFRDKVSEETIIEELSLIALTHRVISEKIDMCLLARNNLIELNGNLQEKSSQKIDSSIYLTDQIWKMWYDEN